MKKILMLFLLAFAVSFQASADEEKLLKPFFLAETAKGSVGAKANEVKNKLRRAGFDIAGEYKPYGNAEIIIVTDNALKKAAAETEFGGYAAGQRVSITKVKNEVQVAYTNPVYMAKAYHLKSDLAGTAAKLEKALGKKQAFGPEEGLEAEDLPDYHYMFGMPYFGDYLELVEYESHEQAVKAVEKALAANKGGVSKVYRIDIPGKDQVVFGVAMTKGMSGDKKIMEEIDFKPVRSTAHLPYEMMVSGNEVYALHAKFRIAINFPDLSMMGDNSFMAIMDSPDAIEEALLLAAGGEEEEPPEPLGGD